MISDGIAEDYVGKASLDTSTFTFFALRPNSKLLKEQQRTTTLALSILMAVLTFGIGHLICKIICEIKKHQMNSHIEKAMNAIQKLGCSKESIQDSDEGWLMAKIATLSPREVVTIAESFPTTPIHSPELFTISRMEKIDQDLRKSSWRSSPATPTPVRT